VSRLTRTSLAILIGAGTFIPAAFPEEPAANRALKVTVGKSLVIDSEADIVRVAVSGIALAETVAINQREIMVNGLMPGETSLVIWQAGGARLVYDLTVLPNSAKLEAVRRQLAAEAGTEGVVIELANDTAFLRGTVQDVVTAERAAIIAGTLGKVVNLLYVAVPPVEAQVLLKVRFVNVDRTASSQVGLDIMTTGHIATPGTISTGQFTLSDALNVFLFHQGFNLSATLTALQSKGLVEILAEPNLLTINGQPASFLAGGEYPYPTTQGGATAGAVTTAFQEYGVRLKFLPTVTARGTIRLRVTPEVSSLDFANGVTSQGFRVPALLTRRVETEVELESGQSFAIAGLLDNRMTETLNKVPGIGNIPVLGKLFQNRVYTATNSELLIIITPELVRPMQAGAPVPDLVRPKGFLKGAPMELPVAPGVEVTGPLPVPEHTRTVPLEQLLKSKEGQQNPSPAAPQSPTAPSPGANSGAPVQGPVR
jgi:pilus assembly protein CpaC